MKGKMIEIEQFQTWICIECGTNVVSQGRPSMRWDDGHACIFVLEKSGSEEEEGSYTLDYPAGTPLKCNQCQAKFMVEEPLVAHKVNLVFDTAYQLRECLACPECGKVDLHWIFITDTSRIPRR